MAKLNDLLVTGDVKVLGKIHGNSATADKLTSSTCGDLSWSGDHYLSSDARPDSKLHFGTDALYRWSSAYGYSKIIDTSNVVSIVTPDSINAFGRGGGIWSGTDLNDFKSFGAILITSSKANQPPNAAPYATVWNICGDGITYLIQNYFDAVNKKYYHREYVDEAWNSWKTNIDSANIGSQSVASATKATQDASGNVITSTYATKSELQTAIDSFASALTTGAW